MGKSTIGWTDYTFNPWIGCTMWSPGCLHCYAETRDRRHLLPDKRSHWGRGAPRYRTSEANWREPLKWNLEPICSKCGRAWPARGLHPDCDGETGDFRRPRVFCASQSDWLDDEVPIEWLADLLALIHQTPNLDWQLLTKRPENWDKRIAALAQFREVGSPQFLWELNWLLGKARDNVQIGTSIEDQLRADEWIPVLLKIPAAVRFLSCEPLLGPVDLNEIKQTVAPGFFGDCLTWYHRPQCAATTPYPTVSWVICGGESGSKARPFHIEWANSLRDQCTAAGVKFFMKQLGTNPFLDKPLKLKHPKGEDPAEWPADLRVQEFITTLS